MAHTVNGLMNTSIEDLRSSLYHIDDIGLLRQALQEAIKLNHSTRAVIISRWIKKLQKEGKG